MPENKMRHISTIIAFAVMIFPQSALPQSSIENPIISSDQIARCTDIGAFRRDITEYRLSGGGRAAIEEQSTGDPEVTHALDDIFNSPLDILPTDPGALEVALRVIAHQGFLGCINRSL